MLILANDDGSQRLVLDGEWILKLRGGHETGRIPVREYERVSLDERHFFRRWLLFGPKRTRLRVVLHAVGGLQWMWVEPERRPEVEAFFAAVEAAKAAATGF